MVDNMSKSSEAVYTLYSSPFSLYSMMARHTIYLGPTTRDARPPKTIKLSFVNHRQNANLEEEYLVKVNPKGQVPTMTGSVLEHPLTDSQSISLHLARDHYPAMLPVKHAATIVDLLQRFHAIPGPSFSNKHPTAEMTQHDHSPVESILKRPDLSPEYRAALEAKLAFHDNNYGIAFQPAVRTKALEDLQGIFAEIVECRRQYSDSKNDAEWTFGAEIGPTVLDSHLLPLVLRCIDVDNAELVPEELQRWAQVHAKGPVWQKVMHGRSTRWDASMGPVADMQEMMSL